MATPYSSNGTGSGGFAGALDPQAATPQQQPVYASTGTVADLPSNGTSTTYPPSPEMADIPIAAGDDDHVVSGASAPSGGPVPRAGSINKKMLMWIGLSVLIFVGVILGVIFGLRARGDANGGGSSPERKAQLEDVVAFLQASGVTAEADFRTGTTQLVAATWLARVDRANLAVPSNTSTPLEQYKYVSRYVLALLWYSMDGHLWDENLFFMTSRDVCDWHRSIPVRLPNGQVANFRAGAYCENTTETLEALFLGTLRTPRANSMDVVDRSSDDCFVYRLQPTRGCNAI